MDRLEKWIANISNNEELKQIVKENVKAVLFDNKMLKSTAFAAMIQTVKADPQLAKLIQNIPCANDGEQHKDNDINITKYLEFNKDRISDFTEENYENLVEALTNDSISSAAASSSNPTISLPSSSAFLGPYNKSDTYKTEKEEMFHHSKGDIAD